MLEGALSNCFCIVPNKLSYVELFPSECRYNTEKQLAKMLRRLVKSGKIHISEQVKKQDLAEELVPKVSNSVVISKIIYNLTA